MSLDWKMIRVMSDEPFWLVWFRRGLVSVPDPALLDARLKR